MLPALRSAQRAGTVGHHTRTSCSRQVTRPSTPVSGARRAACPDGQAAVPVAPGVTTADNYHVVVVHASSPSFSAACRHRRSPHSNILFSSGDPAAVRAIRATNTRVTFVHLAQLRVAPDMHDGPSAPVARHSNVPARVARNLLLPRALPPARGVCEHVGTPEFRGRLRRWEGFTSHECAAGGMRRGRLAPGGSRNRGIQENRWYRAPVIGKPS